MARNHIFDRIIFLIPTSLHVFRATLESGCCRYDADNATPGFPLALDRHVIMKLCLLSDKLSDSPGGQEDAAKD
jgi:hypothetical protein